VTDVGRELYPLAHADADGSFRDIVLGSVGDEGVVVEHPSTSGSDGVRTDGAGIQRFENAADAPLLVRSAAVLPNT
jgi:hypothetical protein